MIGLKHFLWLSIFGLGFVSTASAQTSIVRMPWYETRVDSNRITFTWNTTTAVHSTLRSGLTSSYELPPLDGGSGLSHSVTLNTLQPSTTYSIQIVTPSDTVAFFSSTSSDYRSTGAIEVFFNRSADTLFKGRLPAVVADQNYMALLAEKILNARASIDLAVYSYSGATGDSVTSWLIGAKRRGIKIRLIADSAAAMDSPPYKALAVAGIPTIVNSFGNNAHVASYIHHNKFIVIDGRADDGANVWVLSGSWNLSDEQTTTDYQNIVHFQDLSLARTFEREFDQEWGSSGDLPDPQHAEFSTNKHDTTARSFNIGGVPVHLFFSPNMGAFSGINFMLQSVRHQVLYALLVFTRQDLAQTLITDHVAGIDIHGIVNNTDKYEQTSTLRSAGIDALTFTGGNGVLLHHKYAILDAGTATAAVITGSYNWSLSAETINNENLLIIESNAIAEQYYQEWLQRYSENGGVENVSIPLGVASCKAVSAPLSVFPNPTRARTRVEWMQEHHGIARITIFDPLGRTIDCETVSAIRGNMQSELQSLPRAGVYQVSVEHDDIREVRKVVALQ